MPDSLYMQLADRLGDLIRGGAYQAGERFLSIRQTSREHAASISTVTQAYRVLESLDLVESRPRSGYYVSDRWQAATLSAPTNPGAAADVTSVSVSGLVDMMFKDALRPGLIHFGAAVPSDAMLPTAALLRLAGRQAREQGAAIGRYTFAPGTERLRSAISRLMTSRGVTATPDDIVITNGCQDALMTALQTLCKPGDTVAIETPAFYAVLLGMEELGLRAVEVPCDPVDGMDLDALAGLMADAPPAAVLVTPSYSNPLGACIPTERRERLVALCSHHAVPLIEDDIYGDLSHDGPRLRACKAFDRDGGVLYCSSFSKTLGPIFRAGWILPGRYLEAVRRRKQVADNGTERWGQETVAAFLESGGYDRHLRSMRRMCAEQVMRVRSAVAHGFPAGTTVSRPAGGFVLWVRLPEGVDGLTLYERAKRANIGLAPGVLFSPSGGHRGCIRLSCGRPWSDEVATALHRLGELARPR